MIKHTIILAITVICVCLFSLFVISQYEKEIDDLKMYQNVVIGKSMEKCYVDGSQPSNLEIIAVFNTYGECKKFLSVIGK